MCRPGSTFPQWRLGRSTRVTASCASTRRATTRASGRAQDQAGLIRPAQKSKSGGDTKGAMSLCKGLAVATSWAEADTFQWLQSGGGRMAAQYTQRGTNVYTLVQ